MSKFYSLSIFVALTLWPLFVSAQSTDFEVDEKLEANARKWAGEFITFAKGQYDIDLDWSHTSIKYLDDIVDSLHKTYVDEHPGDEELVPISRALGSYVAEVYRILHGGEWGWVEISEAQFPGIKAKSGATFLPFAKALDRIKTRKDPDIWEYYGIISDY